MSKPLIFLASPYNHPNESVRLARFRAAAVAGGKLIHQGNLVYCPIAHSHPMANEISGAFLGHNYSGEAQGIDEWIGMNNFYLSKSDILVILCIKGWQESEGIRHEFELAHKLEKPAIYIPSSFVKREAQNNGYDKYLLYPEEYDNVRS